MPIVCQGQITITDLNDGINGENGKTYILNILNGVRSVTYDANGKNPSPSQTAFSCELYEDGVLVTPSSYSWSATGLLSGVSTTQTFTPICSTSFSNANNSISLTIIYNGQKITSAIPISITRIGTSGDNAIIAVLSNETHTVPTDNSGNNGNYSGANTTMYVYNGAADDSSNWTVTATSSNVTGSLSGKTYTVTAMTADTGYVDLTASRSGYTSITKRFTLTKTKQGAAGTNGTNGTAGQNATVYKLITSVAAIAKNTSNVYTPSTMTVTATSATGTASPVAYAGRFVISETTDGSSYTAKYTSSANESSKIYTPSAGIKAINVKLYLAGGTTTLLDEQTVPIVSDGAKGDKGDTGASGSPGVSITKVDVEYAVNTSPDTAPSTGWSTTTPPWVDGQYIWSRTKTTYSTGDSTSTNPACITGGKGQTGSTGSPGKGIVSITELYKLLDTKAQQPTPTSDTGWSTTPPTWSVGKYVHTCSKIVYQNPASTTYTVPVCDSSWDAINDFNTQQNIFNTLTNNGADQGIYLQNQKVYINGEYIKAGTIAADKLIIGVGEGGGLSSNPAFKSWSGTYPDGTAAWSSGGISKQTVDGRVVAQFDCPVSGGQYGMSLSSSFFANGVNLDSVEFLALEVKFRLTSGPTPLSAAGACLLFDMYNTDNSTQRLQLNMAEAGTSLTLNTWYTVRKVFKITDVNLAKTYKSCSGYLLANWSGSGNAIKTIQFATANVYIATEQDYLTQTWTYNGTTEINGSNIRTGTLDAGKITTGTLDANVIKGSAISAINVSTESATINAAKIANLDASKITSGTITADRIDANTIISKVNGATTTISGNKIRTGILQANTGGSYLNLDNGSMLLGATTNSNYLQWTGSALNIKGNISATSGTIAGYTISGNQLIGTNVGMSGASGQGIAFWAGHSTPTSAAFQVSHAGVLTCTGANISGTINATSGSFTGSITSSTISGGSISGANLTVGSNFSVNGSTGVLTAKNANITGTITATSGSFTGSISSSTISGGTISGATIQSNKVESTTSYDINMSGASFLSSITSGNSYNTINIKGSVLTIRSGYLVGNAYDSVLTATPETLVMLHGVTGNKSLDVDTSRSIGGLPGVIMEDGLKVSGTTTTSDLNVNGTLKISNSRVYSSSEWTSSKTTNGYCKYPNGVIIQWGYILMTPTAAGTVTSSDITFPIAFPSACRTIQVNPSSAVPDKLTQSAGGISASGFTLYMTRTNTTATGYYWFAAGY